MNMHVVNFRFILVGIRASPCAHSVAAPRVSPGVGDEQIRLALAKHVATLFSVMTRSRFTNILQGTRFPGMAENPPACRMRRKKNYLDYSGEPPICKCVQYRGASVPRDAASSRERCRAMHDRSFVSGVPILPHLRKRLDFESIRMNRRSRLASFTALRVR